MALIKAADSKNHKSQKGVAQMRPDGCKSCCAAKKNILCEQTAARRRPDSQKKGLLRSDDAADSKRKFAAQRPKKLRKRKFLRSLHLSVAVAKKIYMAP
jgi:hypothetical protein